MRGENRHRRGQDGESGVSRATAAEVTRLARRQHGVVSRRQLLAMGMDKSTIERRVNARRLIRIRSGHYRVGPIAQPLEREMAAFLACGRGAVLSHQTAAAIHSLLHPARSGPVHVTVTGSDRGPKPGIRMYRTRLLPSDEITRREGIPVTTPARTVIDVAPRLRPAALEQLIAEAHRKRFRPQLVSLIARYPNRPGVPAIRAMLRGKPQFTRSKAERRLLEALRRAGFAPQANAKLGSYEVDILIADHHLILEIDGHPFHSSRPDRRRDYARDAELNALGYTVLRIDADEPAERAIALVARATR
jgi:very-short-patch-repair endonuclease